MALIDSCFRTQRVFWVCLLCLSASPRMLVVHKDSPAAAILAVFLLQKRLTNICRGGHVKGSSFLAHGSKWFQSGSSFWRMATPGKSWLFLGTVRDVDIVVQVQVPAWLWLCSWWSWLQGASRCVPLVAQCWHPALALWCTCSCFAALLSLDISLLGCATTQYVGSGIRRLQ